MKHISRSNSETLFVNDHPIATTLPSETLSFTNKVSEGKEKLHDFSGRPRIFRDDPGMELDYQRDSVRSMRCRTVNAR